MRHALLWLTLAAGLGIAACGTGDRPSADAETVTFMYRGGDEFLLGPANDDETKFLVFLPLVEYADACHEAEPTGLAERWEHSPDYRRWTVQLRDNVRWHDGVPVTAHDIAFSIRLWKHPDVGWYGGAAVDSVTVVADRTIVFYLKRPGTYPVDGWDVFYPKHLLEGLDPKGFFEWEFWTHPVGNGPFRYVRHDPETMMEFAANPDDYRGKPAIDLVVMRLGGGSPMTELLSGNVDIVDLSPAEAARLAGDDRFRVHYGGWGNPIRLVWNSNNPLFADRLVRRALTLSIDRRALARVLGLPDDIPITDGVYSLCQFERRDLPAAWPHDPREAAALLDAAGWRDEDGDGVRERDGRPFRFTTILDPDPRWRQAATFAQDQLRRVGIQMELQTYDQGVVVRRYRRGEYEAAIPRMAEPDSFLPAPTWFAHQQVAESLRQLSVTIDRDARHLILGELSDFYRTELPATFLFARVAATAARRPIRGIGGPAAAYAYAERLWVEREER